MTSAASVKLGAILAGAVVSALLGLWFLGAALFSVLDEPGGAASRFSAPPIELVAQTYAAPGGVIAQSESVYSVKLYHLLGRPVYQVESADGPAVFDARTSERLSPFAENQIREIAGSAYIGSGSVDACSLVGEPPVWRVVFDDAAQTQIFISPATGEIIDWKTRASAWRGFLTRAYLLDSGADRAVTHPLVALLALSLLWVFAFLLARRFLFLLKVGAAARATGRAEPKH